MRKIKFRAWDKINKKMIEWNDLYIGLNSESAIKDHFEQGKKDGYIFMQYVGLEDINGVEIYEGDIVKWKDDSNLDMGNIKLVYIDIHGVYPCRIDIDSDDWEVIGNIYENPELIRKIME